MFNLRLDAGGPAKIHHYEGYTLVHTNFGKGDPGYMDTIVRNANRLVMHRGPGVNGPTRIADAWTDMAPEERRHIRQSLHAAPVCRDDHCPTCVHLGHPTREQRAREDAEHRAGVARGKMRFGSGVRVPNRPNTIPGDLATLEGEAAAVRAELARGGRVVLRESIPGSRKVAIGPIPDDDNPDQDVWRRHDVPAGWQPDKQRDPAGTDLGDLSGALREIGLLRRAGFRLLGRVEDPRRMRAEGWGVEPVAA